MLSGPGALFMSSPSSSFSIPLVVMSSTGISGKGLSGMCGVSMFSCVNTAWK